jgi:hypothetical protein
MTNAAVTFVYNEAVNLPIWIRYYGKQFGNKNLFVIDRESTDGSTESLGEVNRIVIPRDAFDDRKKADFMSSFQNALTSYYDAVICSDCDELVVPDPGSYGSLNEYIVSVDFDYVTCVGLNILHIINLEPPLDPDRPILAQRRFARFRSATCKTILSRIPLRWLPGLHSLNQRPKIDPNLFMFHTKTMDYSIASARQQINVDTAWSDYSLERNFGAHHRYEYSRFVRELFLDPMNAIHQQKVVSFDFAEEISEFNSQITEKDGSFWVPMGLGRWVEIPERFGGVF